jgi:hypothetical protein
VHIINFSKNCCIRQFCYKSETPLPDALPSCLGFVRFFLLSNFLCCDLKQSKYFNIVAALNRKLSHTHLVSQMLTPSESLLILRKDCLFVCLFVYCSFSHLICHVVVGDACFMFSIDTPLSVQLIDGRTLSKSPMCCTQFKLYSSLVYQFHSIVL